MGQIINRNKSKLDLKRQTTFMGWSWNTESMTLQTTKVMRKQEMAALIKQAQLIQQQQYQTVRSVARLIEQIQYIRVQYTRVGLHITSMNREMSKRAKIARWDSQIKLSRRALIEVKTDNTTACYNLTEWKAKVAWRSLIDQILLYIDLQQSEVKFRHMPGINNTEADSLSRLVVSGDQSIDKQMQQQVLEEWEIQITIDCFAIRRNAKHHRYFSIESDALTKNWNGMEQSWECEIPLLHCPISLIPAVIYKVELEQVKGIIIAPIWKGHVWWTALMRITVHWKELGDCQSVFKEGAWMKRNKQKLPPGKIETFFVVGERRESNYSKNAYQIQDQQDNQFKEQQMDGTEVGRDTHALQQYLQFNYATYLKRYESDACIIQARNSISTLFELIGKPMISIRNKVIEQLMKEHVDRAVKVRKEIRYWKPSQLMQYICKQATLRDEKKLNPDQLMKISLIFIIVYTVLRMAEVQRVELRIENINQGKIIIATMTMKKPRGPVDKTLKAAQDRTICPIRWIWSWLEKREVNREFMKEEVLRNRRNEKVWSADKCSKGVKQVLVEAGIEGYNITSIRKASISETIDKNMKQIQINRWSGHSDASATMKVNYNKNDNGIIRNVLEQASKQPSLNERKAVELDAIITPLRPLNASNGNKNDRQYINNDDASNNNNNSDNKQFNYNDDTNKNNCDKIEQE
ncbi:MAG: hypothetical protein EZS28_002361 [Streblomastix strix]|uniref:Tyr recombinase domain-containing protein n=1 Tax=Streblomastix strix TaxID=222440 RepID=A0A5J4X4F3_9EUKA|nr:MAG: hypothetical protein EZS28_002361 [Streblomastix strix]